MQQAFYIATVGRPGPVLVDIPADIQRSYCELVWRNKISHSNFKVRTVPHPAKITKAATLINNAVKPLLYIGGGAIHAKARDAILELAEKAKIPIVSTLMGLGVIPNNHPNYLEMPGVHGNYAANMAFQHCDLIIAVGARFDNRVTANIEGFARHAKVIHIDIDPAVINQNVHVDLPVVGDANIAVTNINKQIKSVASRVWLKQVQMWKKTHPLKYKNSHKLHPQSIVSKVSELTQHEAIVVTDVGQHQMWAAQFYQFNYPRQWLSSGGCGTMGFGLPAAIGAKLAHPHKTVILITSEGSFQMTMQELAVVAINKLDIKIFILNNNYYGMIRQAQQIYFNHNYFAVDLSTSDGAATSRSQKKKNELDFALIAEAYNIKTLTIDSVTTADKVLRQAFKLTGPVLVNIMIEREENVLPLIEPNKSLDDIILTLL